jgi:two-component system chemotaxis sensor kinase CheA
MRQQDKYAQLFAAEAREHLAEMNRGLMALEEEPGNRESLDGIFRSVHTIKGMAAAMGYDVATRLAHNIESVLDELRGGRRRVASHLVDLLLESGDLLDAAVGATVAGQEPPDPAVLIERLVVWRMSVDEPPDAQVESGPASGPEAAARAEDDAGSRERPPKDARVRPSDTSRVRVPIGRLDALMNLIGELTIVRDQMRALAAQLDSELLDLALEKAGRLIADMQTQVVESRMVPVWQVFDRFPRLIREAARSAGKEVQLEITGKELELDRSLLDAIGDPLVHLLRNAVDHGIEVPEERQMAGKKRQGLVVLAARRERTRVVIEVSDDGSGIDRGTVTAEARRRGLVPGDIEPSDQELYRIMARPGFSTVGRVTTLSGRGVGLNVVEECVRTLGGSVELRTEKGLGTTFRLELPLTLVILPALMVSVAGQVYAVPVTFTRESIEIHHADVERAHDREWIRWHDELLPLLRLHRLFGNGSGKMGSSGGARAKGLRLVVLEFGGSRLAVSVDGLVGEEEIVVKSFDLPVGAVPVFSGATVRPDGRPALVLDVGSLFLSQGASS